VKTVKTSRQFIGSIISLRALCLLEDRSFPVGAIDIVATDGVRYFSGQISSGDVDCAWAMAVWQNGFWSLWGDFHDGGTVAGDFFFLELLLDSDHSVGARLEGSILNVIDSRHLSLSKHGSDRWIRENWHKFEGSGPTVRLHAAPSLGGIVLAPLVALAAVPFVVYVVAFFVVGGVIVISNLAAGKTYRLRRCSDPPDTFGQPSSQPCIEAVPVDEQPGGLQP
jgi:hypothetical protein